MFDTSNLEKINDEAYVWRSFLSPEISDQVFQESWNLSQDENKYVREIDGIELLGGKMDQRVIDSVNNFFCNTEFEIKSFLHWHVPDGVWFAVHRDDEAPDDTPMKKAWAGVIYLSDMDGGALFYPTNNTWVQPKKGDLVLHTSGIPHGALPVKGNNKRTITFVIYDKNKPNDTISGEELGILREKAVHSSQDFLNSEIGKLWKEKYFNDYKA
jgi:hypothetical protein